MVPTDPPHPDHDPNRASAAQETDSTNMNPIPVAELADRSATDDVTVSRSTEPSELDEAEIIDAEMVTATEVSLKKFYSMPPMPAQFENLAANGGAVTALLLGLMAVVGVWFSGWAALNAVMALAFGVWGLTSRIRSVSLIGMSLAGIALLVAMVF